MDVGSDLDWAKRWWCRWVGRRDRRTPLDGVIEVVGGGKSLVSSLGEIEVCVVDVEESRWRHLMVMGAGVDGDEKRRWTRVGVDGSGRVVDHDDGGRRVVMDVEGDVVGGGGGGGKGVVVMGSSVEETALAVLAVGGFDATALAVWVGE